MELNHENPSGYLYFRSCGERSVTVVDRVLEDSFLLAPDRLIEHWAIASAESFDVAAAEALIALAPEVVLLGTGRRQAFPPREAQAALLRRRIGIEVMDNAAACRTYNVLAGEGRRVLAAIMLENGAAADSSSGR